jgi:hypothetical protein
MENWEHFEGSCSPMVVPPRNNRGRGKVHLGKGGSTLARAHPRKISPAGKREEAVPRIRGWHLYTIGCGYQIIFYLSISIFSFSLNHSLHDNSSQSLRYLNKPPLPLALCFVRLPALFINIVFDPFFFYLGTDNSQSCEVETHLILLSL